MFDMDAFPELFFAEHNWQQRRRETIQIDARLDAIERKLDLILLALGDHVLMEGGWHDLQLGEVSPRKVKRCQKK